MTDNGIEPLEVIQAVEFYIEQELSDAAKYDNREPFDESGIWSLHQLARDIYARGVDDGTRQEGERQRRQRSRDREEAKANDCLIRLGRAEERITELEAERDDARGRVVRMNEAHEQTVATLRESRARIAELEAELATARNWAGQENAEHREGRR